MIQIENIEVTGWKHAVRAMRNPMNSWSKSDSAFCEESCYSCKNPCDDVETLHWAYPTAEFALGDNDLDLMRRLHDAGVEHRTFARMVMAYMDITAPLYWWKEMDRYRIGKEQISTSTMHKIHAKEFTVDDFSHEHLSPESMLQLSLQADYLNHCRDKYLESKSKEDWWQMIQLLPSSYNQRRTVMLSYETAMKIIKERSTHKLDEWRTFCDTLNTLPYMRQIKGDHHE